MGTVAILAQGLKTRHVATCGARARWPELEPGERAAARGDCGRHDGAQSVLVRTRARSRLRRVDRHRLRGAREKPGRLGSLHRRAIEATAAASIGFLGLAAQTSPSGDLVQLRFSGISLYRPAVASGVSLKTRSALTFSFSFHSIFRTTTSSSSPDFVSSFFTEPDHFYWIP